MLVELDYKVTINIPDDEIIDGLNGAIVERKAKLLKRKY
jgi:hypothetical protein